MRTLYLICFVFSISTLWARPTTPSSNVTFGSITCTSVSMTWTKGDGTRRLLVIKEGQAPSFIPQDGVTYTANGSVFTNATHLGNNEYLVFNDTNNNLTINGLSGGKTYYIKLYEFDYSGSEEEYLVTGINAHSYTTYNLHLSFDTEMRDSCEKTASVKLINTSTTSISGINYQVNINGKDMPFLNQGIFPVSGSGYQTIILKVSNPVDGCPNATQRDVRIIPKEMGYIDFKLSKDTIQEFENNYFEFISVGKQMPFPAGVNYKWDFGDSSQSYFSKGRHSYNDEGRYEVNLHYYMTINGKMTACSDTDRFTVLVGRNHFKRIIVSPRIQIEDSNTIHCHIEDSTITYATWHFSDGDSTIGLTAKHRYNAPDTYLVKVIFNVVGGKTLHHEIPVIILPLPVTKLSELEATRFSCYPNPAINHLKINANGAQINNSRILIYDQLGRVIQSVYYTSNDINIMDLAPGMYHLELIAENGETMGFKFMKL